MPDLRLILLLCSQCYVDSPYQSFSTFAGNPYYIDLTLLIQQGLLTQQDCTSVDFGTDSNYVDYEKIYNTRFLLLEKAYLNAKDKGYLNTTEYKEFLENNKYWLEDYALYMAVKVSLDNISWIEWEEDIRLRKSEAMKKYQEQLAKEIEGYYFQQYLFSTQWSSLKNYANKKGIEIVGDIPIYVAFDSADTWANPELFQLNEENIPIGVAGCPPDAFCATGQLWGNPLYKWEYHAQTDYEWWIKRIAYCYELYDVVRIDHFRGFDEYWFVPYGDETAEFGHWVKGPGYDLFQAIKNKLGNKKVIAEDLGFLTKSVIKLVKKTGYPGMKILQFAFGSGPDNEYLPHNCTKNSIVYTGTHDNETMLGWYTNVDAKTRRFAKQYLDIHSKKEVEWKFIAAALGTIADTAIIPMQDYLGIGNEGRINTPSTLGQNWEWRMQENACTAELAEKIYHLTKIYGRL